MIYDEEYDEFYPTEEERSDEDDLRNQDNRDRAEDLRREMQ